MSAGAALIRIHRSRLGLLAPRTNHSCALRLHHAVFRGSPRARHFSNPMGLIVGLHDFDLSTPAVAQESKLAQAPDIAVPAITLEGDANGAPHPDASAYRGKFTGKYKHRVIEGGVGHNLPQEAPKAFADAIIEVDSY
jgi:pimeloyl-ACP methyl ester carboxylesterase